ncbi:MAG: hypothetical protein M3R04_10765 [bacterium]|nr:hypothetical protein [bacterium]
MAVEMKTRKHLRQLLLAGALLALLGASLHFWSERERPYSELREAVGNLQLEIERFAVEREGSYPPELARFIEIRGIKMPDNPFGPGKMKILKPGDPWEPGGIVYVGWGPVVALGESTGSMPPIIPTDIDQYLLIGYSPRRHRDRRPPEISLNGCTIRPIPLPNVDWEHVEIMLTAGEDYDSLR